jgi:peptidoglycan hydrolase-like protein with peptidoglycan-binding domain
MGYPTIQMGSTGAVVKVAQEALDFRGYPVGPVDGIFGIHTYRAVVKYQKDRSSGAFWELTYPLVIDGIIGPKTWGRLAPDTVREGSTGTGVRLLPSILKHTKVAEWDPGAIDGIFGPKTKSAVRNYQSSHHLAVDGIVGPLTWRTLWS